MILCVPCSASTDSDPFATVAVKPAVNIHTLSMFSIFV